MPQSAAPLIQPARERTGEETDAAQGTALLRQRSQEDLCLAQRVERALRATGYGPLRGIEVTVHARLVIPETGRTDDRIGRSGGPSGPQRPGREPAELTPPGGTPHATTRSQAHPSSAWSLLGPIRL
jgi:hypothetical protein